MKRIFAFVLLLSLLTVFSGVLHAQSSRVRRVGQNPPPPEPPAILSTPPVLAGPANGHDQNATQPAAVPNQGPEEVDERDVIKVNTTLVTIPVSVTDRDGRYIPDLRKEDFRIWEDGSEQNVAYFNSVDKPFTVVLMIDTSGSTRFRLEEIQDAAIAFVNQLRPDDRVMVVSFDDSVRILSEFTNDRYRLRDAIMHTRSGQGTKLYEAVDLVINQRLTHVSGRKAIVLFTDGVDTTSRRATYQSNVRDAQELDALIYPVQFDTLMDAGANGGGWPSRRPSSSAADILIQILGGGGGVMRRGGGGGPGTSRADYERADRYLHELADSTGARLYKADTTQNLSFAFANVAEELRRQYSLGYYPKKPAQPGQRRQIRVRVNQPNLAVRARDSYIFNPSASVRADDSGQSAPVLRKKLARIN